MTGLIVEAFARTHVGLVRRRNEDSFLVGTALFAVADGLGGHAAGDVASSTVIDTLRPYDGPADQARLSGVLGRAIYSANEALRRRAEADPALAGMGSTLVAMLCSQTTMAVANIGDSRAYLLRGRQLTQLTEDHIYGRLLADAADVPHLPERITRFLDGRRDGRSPDIAVRELHPGDRFLLCSDGLTNVVPSEGICDTLATTSDREEAAEFLVKMALEGGGPDNVTVIVLDVRTT
jgi:serine/threonine protein phosphatase PrpC